MMHIYVCENCKKAYMISRRKWADCRCCGKHMISCSTEFNDWVEKNEEQRKRLIEDMCKKAH